MPDLPAVYLFTDGGSAHSRKRRLQSFIFCSAFQLRQLSYLVPRLDGVRYTISPGEWGCRFFFRKNRLPSLGSEYLDAAHRAGITGQAEDAAFQSAGMIRGVCPRPALSTAQWERRSGTPFRKLAVKCQRACPRREHFRGGA